MTARGRLMSGCIAVVIAMAGFVTAGALPAAAKSRIVHYVALGDSYAAGQGAPPYSDAECLQSDEGYPALLDLHERIYLQVNATCTGAKTSDVATKQLSKLNPDTRLVTLTVGGNDLNVSSVATTCLAGTLDQCLMAVEAARGLVPMLRSALIDLFAKAAAAAPDARIVVTGYPYLLDSSAATVINPDIIPAIRLATDELNTTIEQAVTATQATDVNIRYVDVTAKFEGHGIYSAVPFINRPGPEPLALHPNSAGNRAYADAILARLPGGWLDKQKQLV